MSLTYSDFLYPLPDSQRLFGLDSGEMGTLPDSLSQHLRSSHSNLSTSSGSSYLPNEFQILQDTPVPLLQNIEVSDQDFIIIAEFSELKGPITIATIPSNAPDKTDVDLNNFCLHLLTTDYQVNTVGHFGICEDTQVLRLNVFQGVHVFMQYFTLYDIKARGFVRPFCFGYVCKDSIKLERMIKNLIDQFNEISRMLKFTNRTWFAAELDKYLVKLRGAKEEFIFRSSFPSEIHTRENDADIILDVDEQQSCDEISLNQIAQQYSEIEDILKTVKTSMTESDSHEVQRIFLELNLPSFTTTHITSKLDFSHDNFASLDIPLLHPLKQKGESLRPLSILGQSGTIAFVLKLMKIYLENRQDLLFTEMDKLVNDFRQHFELNPEGDMNANRNRKFEFNESSLPEVDEDELYRVVEKIHTSVPIVSSDSKSGSYHSFSTEESDAISTPRQTNRSGNVTTDSETNLSPAKPDKSFTNSPFSASSFPISSTCSTSTTPNLSEFVYQADMSSSWTIVEPRLGHNCQGVVGIMDEFGNIQPSLPEGEAAVEIQKQPWWKYAEKTKLQRNSPGYGIRKFWLRFPKAAHHILYSILIGRPIIFFGQTESRLKVFQTMNALIPFIPYVHRESFKVIYWHQGILIRSHLDGGHKLIGLCIPERLGIHDLLNPRDQNVITILDVEKKRILGPAYSGNYLKRLDSLVSDSFLEDLCLMTLIGGILIELETHMYMIKSMQVDNPELSFAKITKELGIKSSDIEIMKYLTSLVQNPEDVADVF